MAESDPANHAMAQTLNYALGNLRGRQKSWMHASNPGPSPSGLTTDPLPLTARRRRPRRKVAVPRPTHPPQTTEFAQPTIERRAERQPPSNSASPQLANVVARRDNLDHGPSSVTVFPSPTPSEDNLDSAPVPALRGGNGAANLNFFELEPAQSSHVPKTPLATAFMDEVRRAGRGPQRPSEEAGGHAEKRSRIRKNRQPSSSLPRPQYPAFSRQSSIPQAQVGSPRLEQPHSRSPSLGQMSNGPAASPQLRQDMQAHPVVGMPSPAQASFGTPRTLSRGTAPHLFSVLTEMDTALPNQNIAQTPQYANAQPDWYTTEECLQVLHSFQASHVVLSDHPRDERRIGVLRDATETKDWQYLIMHQFYCLLDFNPSLLPAELWNKPELNQALRVMQDVLGSNKHLSPAVLYFFSNYPYPLHDISIRWPSTLEKQTRTFFTFIAHSPNYDQLILTCERRRFPPVAWELAQFLALGSTIFQRLLFTALLRYVWRGVPPNPLQSQYEARAASLFQKNQAHFYKRIVLTGNDQSLNAQNVQQDNDADLHHLGLLLTRLVEDLEANLRRQGYTVSTPYVATSPYVQQQHLQIQHHTQNPIITADISSRASLPNGPHSAQPAIQQTGSRGRRHAQSVQASRIEPSTPQAQQSHVPARLLPVHEHVLSQQRQPNPARFSLHQANLRSPVLQARAFESLPLYHFVQSYVKPPARLSNADRAVERWSFTVGAEMAQHIAAVVPVAPGQVDRRMVDSKSKTVRIRCIKWPASEPPSEHIWAITDTSWIPYSYFTFNGTSLQQRKKIHHGKDLPIDLTGLLKEGENILEMTVMAQSDDTSYRNYLVAIEFLGIISHDAVKRLCLQESRISAEHILANLKQRLVGTGEDDEIAIVESNLTINLFDPFSASKICDIPVRSIACLHNDCFDLETFLETRRRKGDVSVPDGWRCPICNADARPSHLIVDGFLQEVKKQLDAQNLSETRAIIVQQDGTWKPKVEVRDPNGVSDRSISEKPLTPSATRASIQAQAEVIDLSD